MICQIYFTLLKVIASAPLARFLLLLMMLLALIPLVEQVN